MSNLIFTKAGMVFFIVLITISHIQYCNLSPKLNSTYILKLKDYDNYVSIALRATEYLKNKTLLQINVKYLKTLSALMVYFRVWVIYSHELTIQCLYWESFVSQTKWFPLIKSWRLKKKENNIQMNLKWYF